MFARSMTGFTALTFLRRQPQLLPVQVDGQASQWCCYTGAANVPVVQLHRCCSCMTGWLFGPCTQVHGPGSPTIRVGKGWRGRRELAPRCSATQLGAFRNEPGQTRRFLNYSYHHHHHQAPVLFKVASCQGVSLAYRS